MVKNYFMYVCLSGVILASFTACNNEDKLKNTIEIDDKKSIDSKKLKKSQVKFEKAKLDFGKHKLNIAKAGQLKFMNNGNDVVKILKVSVLGDASKSFSADAPIKTIPKGKSGVINVKFSRKSKASKRATLVVEMSTGSYEVNLFAEAVNSFEIPVDIDPGKGIDPDKGIDIDRDGKKEGGGKFQVNVKSLDFGKVEVNTSKEMTIVVSNNSKDILKPSMVSFRKDHFKEFKISSFMTNVPPGGKMKVVISYSPTRIGGKSVVLFLNSNMGSKLIPIKGNAFTNDPVVSIDKKELDFGTVVDFKSRDLKLIVSNTGKSDLKIENFLIKGSSDFKVISRKKIVSAGKKETIIVRFRPKITTGIFLIREATLEVKTNVGSKFVSLLGVLKPIIIKSTISVDKTNLNFNEVALGSSVVLPVVVTNGSSESVTLSSISIIGAEGKSFSINEVSRVIPARQTHTINVSFKPLSKGSKNALLKIITSDVKNYVDVGLGGKGI